MDNDTTCLGKTPGYARYSGYDTPEEEAKYLATLGPIWCDGDPMPPEPHRNTACANPL